MLESSVSAGVDVGSTWLDLGFHPFGKPIRVRNNEAGIATIVAALGQRGVGRVALEAIGGYARRLTAALIEADVTVFMVNPRRIKAFRDAEGLIAKTDKLDASLIARFAHVMADELRPLRDAGQAGLKALSTRRRQLTEIHRDREDTPQAGLRSADSQLLPGDDRAARRQTPGDRSRTRPPH